MTAHTSRIPDRSDVGDSSEPEFQCVAEGLNENRKEKSKIPQTERKGNTTYRGGCWTGEDRNTPSWREDIVVGGWQGNTSDSSRAHSYPPRRTVEVAFIETLADIVGLYSRKFGMPYAY